jgi:hypothetical protein
MTRITLIDADLFGVLSAMIRVISVIRVPSMRTLLRPPIAGLYTQLITDQELGAHASVSACA